MADRFVMVHIRRLPMFAALSDDQLGILSDIFRVTRYETHEIIFRQGQPAQGLYMMVTGRGALLQQTPAGFQQVGLIGANQFLNEIALYREIYETASFQVTEPSIVLFLSRQAFQALLASQPQLKAAIRTPNLPPVYTTPPPVAAAPAPSPKPSPFSAAKIQNPPAPPAEASFVPKFKGHRPDEQIYAAVHRHWWALFGRSWVVVVAMVLLLVVVALLPSPELRLAMLALVVVIPGGMVVFLFVDWQNDKLFVTGQRVVYLETRLLTFQRSFRDIPIRSIQGVDSNISNALFGRLFGYGDLVIKTAGHSGTIHLDYIPDPEQVQDILFKRINDKSEDAQRQKGLIREEVERAIGYTAQLPKSVPPKPEKPAHPGLLSTHFVNTNGESVYRKHIVFWWRSVTLPLFLLLGTAALFGLWLVVPAVKDWGLIVLSIVAIMTMIGGVTFYLRDWDWRNDLYIIGKDTVTIIHRRPLWLQNEDDRILISRIDNVQLEVNGFFRSLLNYGDVKMSLVGDANAKIFKGVHDPRRIVQEISDHQAKIRQATIEAEERRRREEISNYIAAYDQAKQSGQPQAGGVYAPQASAPLYTPQGAVPTAPQPITPLEDTTSPSTPPQYGTGIPAARPMPYSPSSPSQAAPVPGARPGRVPRIKP